MSLITDEGRSVAEMFDLSLTDLASVWLVFGEATER